MMLRSRDIPPAEDFDLQLKAHRVNFRREVTGLVPGRKFRCDFYFPSHRLVIEMDGGTFARRGGKRCSFCGETPKGRHSTGVGRDNDCEKLALLMINDYRCITVTSNQVRNGKALTWALAVLNKPSLH